MIPLKHLQGRYSLTDNGQIFGHFEQEIIPIKDDVVTLKLPNVAEASTIYLEYGNKGIYRLNVELLEVWNGTKYTPYGKISLNQIKGGNYDVVMYQ